jgi:ribosomal-protein-alanine N-acetyltransferase
MKLITKRLILRKPKKSDWKDIMEGVGDIDVAKMMSYMPHPYGKKEAYDFIKKVDKEWKQKIITSMHFSIELKTENKIIGGIGLGDIKKFSGTAETGSWINKKYWKNGYVTEAKIAINDFAFKKLKLRRLNSYVYRDNKASNATQKKLGYVLEGVLRKSKRCMATGIIHDQNVYGLLKEDWEKIRPKLIKEIK